jgi:hypothetical protein
MEVNFFKSQGRTDPFFPLHHIRKGSCNHPYTIYIYTPYFVVNSSPSKESQEDLQGIIALHLNNLPVLFRRFRPTEHLHSWFTPNVAYRINVPAAN